MSGIAYNFVGPEVNKVLECPLVFDNTTCTGLKKLMEKVIVLFLKDRETSINPDMGTSILEMQGKGNITVNGELQNYFTLASATVKANLLNPTDPLDEQIDTISAIPVQDLANPGHVMATIRVTSKSGAAATTTISIS